ncbi:hypothetical protein V8C42DRAFT_8605 [Trichoderma barbatum]
MGSSKEMEKKKKKLIFSEGFHRKMECSLSMEAGLQAVQVGNKATTGTRSKHCCPMQTTIPCHSGSRSRYEAPDSPRTLYMQTELSEAPGCRALAAERKRERLMHFVDAPQIGHVKTRSIIRFAGGRSSQRWRRATPSARKLEQPLHESGQIPHRFRFAARYAACRLIYMKILEVPAKGWDAAARSWGARASESCRTPDLCQIDACPHTRILLLILLSTMRNRASCFLAAL